MKKKYEAPQTEAIHLEISNMVMATPVPPINKKPFKEPTEGDADGACAKDNSNILWDE